MVLNQYRRSHKISISGCYCRERTSYIFSDIIFVVAHNTRCQRCLHKSIVIDRRNSIYRIVYSTPRAGIVPAICFVNNRGKFWLNDSKTMLSRNCRHWLPDIPRFTFAAVIALDQERLRVIQNKFLDSTGNAIHCLLRQRTHRPDSVLFFNFFSAIEDARTWE